MMLGLVFIFSQSKAQWTVINQCDCRFTLTIHCNGISESSDDYSDGWAGTWGASSSHLFSKVPCCDDPLITITFDPIYGVPPITGLLSTLMFVPGSTPPIPIVYGCYPISNCLPTNAGFQIVKTGCLIALAKPLGC